MEESWPGFVSPHSLCASSYLSLLGSVAGCQGRGTLWIPVHILAVAPNIRQQAREVTQLDDDNRNIFTISRSCFQAFISAYKARDSRRSWGEEVGMETISKESCFLLALVLKSSSSMFRTFGGNVLKDSVVFCQIRRQYCSTLYFC